MYYNEGAAFWNYLNCRDILTWVMGEVSMFLFTFVAHNSPLICCGRWTQLEGSASFVDQSIHNYLKNQA